MKNLITSNNQAALDYALYMIAASYFKKATCTSGLMEKKLLINYKTQKLDSQYHMEECCIRYMEKELRKILPKDLWEQEVTVSLVKKANEPTTEICFHSSKYILRLKGMYHRKDTKFIYELWKA